MVSVIVIGRTHVLDKGAGEKANARNCIMCKAPLHDLFIHYLFPFLLERNFNHFNAMDQILFIYLFIYLLLVCMFCLLIFLFYFHYHLFILFSHCVHKST